MQLCIRIVGSNAATAGAKLRLANAQIADSEGASITIAWRVDGDSSGVRAFGVEAEGADGAWTQVGNYVPLIDGQSAYQVDIERASLSTPNAKLRVRAIGADGQAIAHSKTLQLRDGCQGEWSTKNVCASRTNKFHCTSRLQASKQRQTTLRLCRSTSSESRCDGRFRRRRRLPPPPTATFTL